MHKNIVIEGRFEIAGKATNGLKAIHLYPQHLPDIVEMNITNARYGWSRGRNKFPRSKLRGIEPVAIKIMNQHTTAKIVCSSDFSTGFREKE